LAPLSLRRRPDIPTTKTYFRCSASPQARQLAEAVVDVLEERGLLTSSAPGPGLVLTVADVAELLGRGRAWVYEHAGELGAFRFGTGPKARLGFDRHAIERWKRERQIRSTAAATSPRHRRRQRSMASAANLIAYEPLSQA